MLLDLLSQRTYSYVYICMYMCITKTLKKTLGR